LALLGIVISREQLGSAIIEHEEIAPAETASPAKRAGVRWVRTRQGLPGRWFHYFLLLRLFGHISSLGKGFGRGVV